MQMRSEADQIHPVLKLSVRPTDRLYAPQRTYAQPSVRPTVREQIPKKNRYKVFTEAQTCIRPSGLVFSAN